MTLAGEERNTAKCFFKPSQAFFELDLKVANLVHYILSWDLRPGPGPWTGPGAWQLNIIFSYHSNI